MDVRSEDELSLEQPSAAAEPAPAAAKAAAPKAKKAKAKGSKPAGRSTYDGLTCMICEKAPSLKKNPFCAACKTDVDAAKKDAKAQNWLEKYESARGTPAIFRRLILDFQQECLSAGSGRKRPTYSRARAQEVVSKEHVADEGVRFMKMDWFGFESFYKSKGLNASEIDAKWKSRIAAEGAYDLAGENKDYPERLLVKVEEYVDAKQRSRRATEVVKEAAQDKKLLEDDAAVSLLKGTNLNWDEDAFGEVAAEMKRREQATAAAPKRRRLSGSGGGQTSEVEEVLSDLAVTRLRGYEELKSLYDKTLASFEQTKDKIQLDVPCRRLVENCWGLDCVGY